MSDDGAQEQPLTEAPPNAAAAPVTQNAAVPIAETMPVAATEAVEEPAPAKVAAPVREDVPSAPHTTPDPVSSTHVPTPVAPVKRGVPPMAEFAAWRSLEFVSTVVIAAALVRLLLPSDVPADALLLFERLGVTVPLLVFALLVAAAIGLPVGYVAARMGSWVDVGLRALATLGASLAPIWLAMLLVLLFSATLQWLKPGGFVPWVQSPLGAVTSLLLPALALGLPLAANVALRMRDALRAALGDPVMRTADIMGFTRREAIRAYALRNALADLSPRLALPLTLLVPASLIMENVFYLPGLGRLIFSAVDARDFATLQLGLTTLVALIALCRLLTRLLHAAVDPRLVRRA